MKKQYKGFLVVAPFTQIGVPEWEWVGASVATALYDKLLVGGLTVVPFYELGQLDPPPEAEILTSWESYIQMADFLADGYILTGSYLFEEKRDKIAAYLVDGNGYRLLSHADETKEDYMEVLDRIAQEIAAAFGKSTNARMRERIQKTSATHNREAFVLGAQAKKAWAAKDLSQVREKVAEAQELEPDFLIPLDILTHAEHELGSGQDFETALRDELTHLTAMPNFYKSLALVEGWLAVVQREGNSGLAAECLKARSALQSASANDGMAELYLHRVQEVEDELTSKLDENEISRLRTLQSKGWTTGQIVSLMLLANSWFRQTEVALQTGQAAIARFYAARTDGLYRLLGNNKRRQQLKDLTARLGPVPA